MKIIYIRTSTKEQTPELQLRDIMPLIDGEHQIFTEKLSAYKENIKRPEFEKVLNLIKKGNVTHLYAWDLDRLYRNRLRLKDLFLTCKNYGTVIHTVNQKWLDDINKIPAPFNDIVLEMLINFMGWIGEEESSKKSERVKLSVKKDSKGITRSYKGAKWGRKAFSPQTITRVLELSANGASLRQIANQVTVYDRKNKNERKISKSAVHKILSLKSR